MQQYRLNTKKPHILCLILLISFPSASTVLISPALPAISDFFKISNGYTQQLITIFIVGYAIGQLIYSPFANRYGRKIAIYLGIGLFFISGFLSLFGIYSHNIEILFIARFIMALGSSVGMIISYTIINDFYHPYQARPIVGYTVLAYAFMPAIANALGGFITTRFTWIGCFYFYLIYGVIILIASIPLPETLQTKNIKSLNFKNLRHDYYHAFSTWRLIIFAVIYGLMTSFIYIIASGAPFIGIDIIHLNATHYGLLLLIPYCGQFIGAFSAGKLSQWLRAYQMIGIGYSCTIFGSLFMFICFLFHWVNSFSLFMPIFFIMMGIPMIYSNATVMALIGFDDKATGSAIMSFITMSIAAIVTFLLTLLPNRYPIIMPALFIVVLILAVIAFLQARTRFSDEA